MWVTHDPDYRVHVAYTAASAEHARALTARYPTLEPIEPETATYTLDELEELQEHLVVERDLVQRGGAVTSQALTASNGRFDVAVNERANRVELITPNDAASLREYLSQTYGAKAIAVSGQLIVPASCESRFSCHPAIMAGLQFVTRNGNGALIGCSSSFIVAAAGARHVLSAGHCYNGVDEWTHEGVRYGGAPVGWLQGSVDAIRVQRDPATSFSESSKVFVYGEVPRPITGQIGYAALFDGMAMCKSGATTGSNCGHITPNGRLMAPSYVPGASRFVKFTACTAQGDSGGAVYDGNRAIGIISGSVSGEACNPGQAGGMGLGPGVFGAIDFALSQLGASLITNLNVAPRPSFTSSCTVLLKCTFSGGGSYDPDGAISSWSWTFGDGAAANGSQVSHTYRLPGTYTVRLTTADNQGTTASLSRSIRVP